MLVCHPRLVQTGLDLVEFPTICWYETDYSVYTMRQASRRSWRIGQTQPVQVVFMAYRNTLQADALKLVAKKLRQGHKLLRLAERYSPARLDAACRRALEVDLIDVRRLERILVEALEQETTAPQQPLPPPPGRFARPGAVFALTSTQTPTGAPR